MKRLKLLLITCVLLALAHGTKTRPVSAEMKSLADAEREFAKLGAATSVRESFPKYFAPEGIIFNPHPAKLHEVFKDRPLPTEPPPIILNWAPEYGDIAASGDFGYDTGPSWRVERATGKTVGYGDFFSVWKKQADGTWKVVLDLGTQSAVPRVPKEFEQASATRFKAKRNADVAKESAGLMDAERAFLKIASEKGLRAALQEHAAENIRLHSKDEPKAGKAAAIAATADVKINGEPMLADVAKSGDMGFDYAKWKAADGKAAGYHVHVWKRDDKAKWKIVARVEAPLPEKQ